jgi:hypothetical protein
VRAYVPQGGSATKLTHNPGRQWTNPSDLLDLLEALKASATIISSFILPILHIKFISLALHNLTTLYDVKKKRNN